MDFSLKQNVVCIVDSNDSFPMVVGYVKMMITLHHAASSLLNDKVSNTKVRLEVCDFFYFTLSLNLKLYGSPIYECWKSKALIFTYKSQKILNMNEKWFSHHTLFDATYITNLKSSRVCVCVCVCMCIHTHLVFLICFLYEIWRSCSGVAEVSLEICPQKLMFWYCTKLFFSSD